jgi:hypothetical protein
MDILQFLLVAIIIIVENKALPKRLKEELARMSHEIAINHFSNTKCIALVTEDNSDIVDLLSPLEVPVLHTRIPAKVLLKSPPLSTGNVSIPPLLVLTPA